MANANSINRYQSIISVLLGSGYTNNLMITPSERQVNSWTITRWQNHVMYHLSFLGRNTHSFAHGDIISRVHFEAIESFEERETMINDLLFLIFDLTI